MTAFPTFHRHMRHVVELIKWDRNPPLTSGQKKILKRTRAETVEPQKTTKIHSMDYASGQREPFDC